MMPQIAVPRIEAHALRTVAAHGMRVEGPPAADLTRKK
jgi:hypothetical protein